MTNVSYLTISDIHLGHRKNKTPIIIEHLDEYFDHYTSKSPFIHLDIIFIAGDMFDGLVDGSSPELPMVLLWLDRLMRFCGRHNIKLRILRGTPSHDWDLPKLSETVYSLSGKSVDFAYIDTLHIEQMKDLNLNVLYVPDEWNADTEVTAKQVSDIMADLNLGQVDIAVMHGSFPHQLPSAAHNVPKHDPAFYLSIVKYFITIGHIHIHSVYERIIAQGSFDRITHGEENPKGGVLCKISETEGNSFTFIENTKATIFKTIIPKSNDLDKTLKQIDKELLKIPENSFVRIKTNKTHPIYIAFDELKLKFPMYFFTKTSIEDEDDSYKIINSTVSLSKDYAPVTISKENVVDLIMNEVTSKHNLNAAQLVLLQQTLESINE